MSPSEDLLKGIPKVIVSGKVEFTEEETAQHRRDFEKILKEMGVLKEHESIEDMTRPFR